MDHICNCQIQPIPPLKNLCSCAVGLCWKMLEILATAWIAVLYRLKEQLKDKEAKINLAYDYVKCWWKAL